MTNIIAVDFDGTLCDDMWPNIGKPHTLLIDHLINIRSQGRKVILWTCREGKYLEDAVKWCEAQGLRFDAVNDNVPESIIRFGGNSRKIFADMYIDDKSIAWTYE